MATFTASAGVPATATAGYPDRVVVLEYFTVPDVILPPTPLWFVAGATTLTVRPGSLRSACTRTSIPGACTPSSFVTTTVSALTDAEALVEGAEDAAGGLLACVPEELLEQPTRALTDIATAARAMPAFWQRNR
jgi:hypothetical protein